MNPLDSLVQRIGCVLLLSCAAANAQTFVVDSSGQPGFDYLEISTAVAAVPDGSTLLVRSGSYQPFAISGKSLSVLGTSYPATRVLGGGIAIDNIGPSQSVWIADLNIDPMPASPPPTPPVAVEVRNCAGLVHLLSVSTSPSLPDLRMGLVADAARQLSVKGCGFERSVVRASAVTFESTNLSGWGAAGRIVSQTSEGLEVDNSMVWLVDSLVYGGHGDLQATPPRTNRPAITMVQGDLRVLKFTILYEGDAASGGPLPYEVTGTGSVVFNSTFPPSRPVAPSLARSTDGQPGLSVGMSTRNRILTFEGKAPVGTGLGALLIGIPGPPHIDPIAPDPIWFAAGAGQLLTIQAFSRSNFRFTVTLPPAPILRGVQLASHLLVVDRAAGVRLSNPSIHIVN